MKWTPKTEQALMDLASSYPKKKDWQYIADKLNQIDPKKQFSIGTIKVRYRKLNKNSCPDAEATVPLRKIMIKKSKNEYQRLYRLQNEDKYRARYRKYNQTKRFKEIAKRSRQKTANDLNFKLARKIMSAVWRLSKSKFNIKSPILKITRNQLREHIESKFDKYMSWDNYGKLWIFKYNIPLSSLDLSNPEEFNKACSLDNISIALK